jgi:hypothetical protein
MSSNLSLIGSFFLHFPSSEPRLDNFPLIFSYFSRQFTAHRCIVLNKRDIGGQGLYFWSLFFAEMWQNDSKWAQISVSCANFSFIFVPQSLDLVFFISSSAILAANSPPTDALFLTSVILAVKASISEVFFRQNDSKWGQISVSCAHFSFIFVSQSLDLVFFLSFSAILAANSPPTDALFLTSAILAVRAPPPVSWPTRASRNGVTCWPEMRCRAASATAVAAKTGRLKGFWGIFYAKNVSGCEFWCKNGRKMRPGGCFLR